MGVVLAVNVEAVEGRNISNVCALNQSHKQCFLMFYSILFVYSYLWCVELFTCPFYCEIQVTPKADFHFMHSLSIIKFFCIIL